MGSWGLGFLQRPDFEQTCAQTVRKAMKICCLVNMFANLTCKMKAASTPNMERQHLKFHALASVCTRLQTSTHALLGQPSSKANTYKQLSFLDPQLFQSQISNSKAISEIATTRHTHTHVHIHKHTYTYTNTPTHAHTHTPIYLLRQTCVICIASELSCQAKRLPHNTSGL